MYDLKEECTEKGNLQFQLFTAAFHNGGLLQTLQIKVHLLGTQSYQ